MTKELISALTNMKWESESAIKIITIIMNTMTLWLIIAVIGAVIISGLGLYIFKDKLFNKGVNNGKN